MVPQLVTGATATWPVSEVTGWWPEVARAGWIMVDTVCRYRNIDIVYI